VTRPPCHAVALVGTQLEVPPMVLLTLEKVLLALLPSAVMATMHTTMIRASMTAYSTAVGPSSRFRKFTTLRVRWENMCVGPFRSRESERRGDTASVPAVRPTWAAGPGVPDRGQRSSLAVTRGRATCNEHALTGT